MATRTINIRFLEQTPQVRTLRFTPRLTSVDGNVLLKKAYVVTTNASGDASIALPVKASGSIWYDVEIPQDGGKSQRHFVLAAGSAIDLDDLIAAGGVPSDSVVDYMDGKVSDAAYDPTAWNGVAGAAPSKNVVRDKLVLIDGISDAIRSGRFSFVIAPTFSGVQNNFNPGANAQVVALFGAPGSFITGIDFGVTPLEGDRKWLYNIGGHPITLLHQNAGSNALNRFNSPVQRDYALGPGESIELLYGRVAGGGASLKWQMPIALKPNEPFGYVAIDNDGRADGVSTGWIQTEGCLQASRIVARLSGNKSLTSDRYIKVDKADGIAHIRLSSVDGDRVFGAIWSEYGGNFTDGEEIIIENLTEDSIVVTNNGSLSEGVGLRVNVTSGYMIWPREQQILCVFDANEGLFRVYPMFRRTELLLGTVDGNLSVDLANYWNWHGKVNNVSSGANILFYEDIPDGFTADFIAGDATDVVFAVDGGTIRNRQNHTKIAGQYGVVTVFKQGGAFYLVGDTKA